MQCLGVVGRHAVGFPIQDQALAVASLKEGEIDHSFDAPIVVQFPKEWHLDVKNRFVAFKLAPKIFSLE